jgi:hypothetical protein
MSKKKETTNEGSQNTPPQGSTNTDRPQSVYITNSDQSLGRLERKKQN